MSRQKGLNTRPVLLLNADSSVLTTISVKRAITLYLMDKVVCLLDKEGKGRIHPALDLNYPSIMCLKRYVYVPHRKIPLTRRNILIRDNFTCQYTGEQLTEKSATIDHVIPKSQKGSPGNKWTNVVACSRRTNNFKGDLTPEQAGLKLAKKPYTPSWEDLVLSTRPEWRTHVDSMRGRG